MKIYISCGFYVGRDLDYYAPLMDESWVVYAFEPNTELNVEESIKRFPFKVQWLKKAVWVEDGEVEFVLDGRDDASHISELRTNQDRKITVSCIDFSRFVAELPKDATIVVSMDCEGAEFPILEKMLVEGTAQRIALLDIEFHNRLLEDKTRDDASNLRIRLESEGILVKEKVEPS